METSFLAGECEQRESNPHAEASDPKSDVSTSSTMLAYLAGEHKARPPGSHYSSVKMTFALHSFGTFLARAS